MVTELQLGNITVDVIFKDIKNVHLSVYPPTGRVRISAPDRMEIENIRLFAISKLGWIKKQQDKLNAQERETPREFLERESHYLWGKRYLLHFACEGGLAKVVIDHTRITLSLKPDAPLETRQRLLDDFYRIELKQAAVPLIEKWEKRTGLQAEKFFVQKMKTMWGSSNPNRRTIRLNLELAKKPHECLDYIILHEIIHFLVPNHGEKFQRLMDQYMPHWPAIWRLLNEEPLAHTDWTY
ncbi:putative metal-dependent hydrolase [Labrenzia sp. EL_126]|nr:putative metal-dependent hydrolase [Labrenzia sp. EL_126]